MKSVMHFRGDRCRCSTCGELFNSTYAFDKHRRGDFHPVMRRRCLSVAEMAGAGMERSLKGFWLTGKRRTVDAAVMERLRWNDWIKRERRVQVQGIGP